MKIALMSCAALLFTTACRSEATPAGSPTPAARASTTAAKVPAKPMGWFGSYLYEWSGGANAAGTGMVVAYTLTLAPGKCELDADGYQTDETILCSTRAIPAGLEVDFKSYGDGRTVDARGNPVFQVGQPLFVLQRSGARILTDWKAYALPDERPHPKDVYFRAVADRG